MNLTSFLDEKQLTIALEGEIDHHSAKMMIQIIGSKIETYLPMTCILDFEQVSFMDSSGIAVVISALRNMRQIGGKAMLRSVPPQPLKVLQASGIDRLITILQKETVL